MVPKKTDLISPGDSQAYNAELWPKTAFIIQEKSIVSHQSCLGQVQSYKITLEAEIAGHCPRV